MPFCFARLFLLERAFWMALLDFADIFLQFTLKLRRIGLKSGVMGSKKETNATITVDDL
jgi:hypothetical protein